MREPTEVDVVIWGATGYLGRIIAEEFAKRADGLSWALGGRSRDRLAAVRDDIGAPAATPLVVADAADPRSLRDLVGRAGAVLSTVGPYHVHGSELVAECAASGVDYVDVSGEPRWSRQMIDRYEDMARRSGARVVMSAAFDSVPFELGVHVLQQNAAARWGAPLPTVRAAVSIEGTDGFSGGTVASLAAERDAAAAERDVPAFPGGLESGLLAHPVFDDDLGSWLAPWILAPINVWNLHRSNVLREFAWGKDFRYEEMMIAGPGPEGERAAAAITTMMAELIDTNTRSSGEGPDRKSGDAASYRILLLGSDGGDRALTTVVTGQGDPGYRSSARIVTEVVECLVQDVPDAPPGFWTPGTIIGDRLLDRLTAHAGLTFTSQRRAEETE